MPTVILVRHGRSTANTAGVLAGRASGVQLDDTGRRQAEEVGQRLAGLPVARLVSSPITRCRQTARRIATALDGVATSTDSGLTECDYGDWTGRKISDLTRTKLWRTVQQQPSAVTFPAGESLMAMGHRAVQAIRRTDAAVAAEHGDRALWVAVSHGDPIKAILADALGSHLDQFQRIVVDPASVSVISFDGDRAHVLTMNSHTGDLGWLVPPKRGRSRLAGAVPGGGAGPEQARA